MDENTEPQEFTLSDLDVMTVGLVERGAVSLDDSGGGKNFFLLKSEATAMTDEIVIEQVAASDPSFLNKVETWLKDVIAKAKGMDAKAVAQAAQVLQDGGYDVTTADLAEMLSDYVEEEMEDDAVEMEDKKKMSKDEAVVEKAAEVAETAVAQTPDALAALETIQKAHLDAIEKAHQAQLEQVMKSLTEKYEGQITSLAERVEKAEKERIEATEARQKREYLEKAMIYRALPVSHVELGEMLFTLAKSVDGEQFAKWEALIKSVDNQLGAAGIFAEMGTSRTPELATLEDKIAKAAKDNGDPAAALLSLTEAEQYELLKSMRGGK